MNPLNRNIIHLDLFSGTGGFALGFQRAGYTVKRHYFSEIDKHAIANYRHNFKNAEYVGSVTDVRGSELPERPNLITFGSPCQDFSLAGKRRGLEGERSSLIEHAIRLITECRPDVFIWENVKGAFSSNAGADFWAIVQAFAHIGGYRLEWQLLNTSWFLPQNRERIYLIGHLGNGGGRNVFPFGETVSTSNDSGQRQTTGSITTGEGNSQNDNTYIIVRSATNAGYETATEGDSINLSQPNSDTRRGRVGHGVAQTLETSCNQAVVQLTEARTEEAKQIRSENMKNGRDFSPRRGKELTERTDGLANTITAGQSKESLLLDKSDMLIRRLTEIECERLQGFPDNWTKHGINAKGETIEISRTQRYKMCGNAVTADVVEAIAERL